MSIAFLTFLYGFLIVTAIVASLIDDILSAVIALSVFGILLAIVFAILQAPDVALTQAVINSGMITSIFLVAYSQTEKGKSSRQKGRHDR